MTILMNEKAVELKQENTCGNCVELMGCSPAKTHCGNPLVYLTHENNFYKVEASTPACAFFFQKKEE